ncbi:MAG TPA: SIS domain-containing protein [Ktedonobacteraceae bacterium]|nr:SIS domain-containing protein [Ktedonobacteraceae bacterium]
MLSHKEWAVQARADQPVTTEIDYLGVVLDVLALRRSVLDDALRQFATRAQALAQIAKLLVEALRAGHKVLVAGNGGSAAEAQHFAAELVGRFKRERLPYAVLSLTTDTSILTAVANDYGYAEVFARQVRGFGLPGDLLLLYSTSGESENLVQAALEAQRCLMGVVALTGDRSSRLEQIADVTLRVPVVDAAVAQELHMMATHILCDITETELAKWQAPALGEDRFRLEQEGI